MATAKDCFNENVKLIGSPVNASTEVMIQWNLNNGLRMLAEQLDRMQMQNQQLSSEIQYLRQQIAGLR